MIITVCTLLSLLQLIKRLKLHVLTKRKLTLSSWGKNDKTTRISATVHINHGFSINFTHFLDILQQQCFFIVTGLMGLSMLTVKKLEWKELSLRANVYNVKFSLEKRLQHGFAIEYT